MRIGRYRETSPEALRSGCWPHRGHRPASQVRRDRSRCGNEAPAQERPEERQEM